MTHVYQVVEYTPRNCFANFVTMISDARREGDVDPDQAIIADTMKLHGNSAYGSLVMNKEKHQDVLYMNTKGKAQLAFNNPLFRKCTPIKNDELYELEMAKSKIIMDLPIQLGYHILQLAKLRMLQFRFDFLDRYCDTRDFEYIEMDTDSAYLALAGKILEDIVHSSKRQELHSQKFLQCHNLGFTASDGFFPRECCQKHKAFDKRTPGLFKVEAEGNAMIALCSKTYILRQDDGVKFSSKGINKNALTDPYTTFEQVLHTRIPHAGKNQGFRPRNNSIFTYEQVRSGISYFYCKRQVLADGVHTKPLDITLSPWPTHPVEVVDDDHPWSLTTTRNVIVNNQMFNTLAEVCMAAEQEEKPHTFVQQAIHQLPPHLPTGQLLVPITKKLKSIDRHYWCRDKYWTTALSPRSSPMRADCPGQNIMAMLLMQTLVTPLVDHQNYIAI